MYVASSALLGSCFFFLQSSCWSSNWRNNGYLPPSSALRRASSRDHVVSGTIIVIIIILATQLCMESGFEGIRESNSADLMVVILVAGFGSIWFVIHLQVYLTKKLASLQKWHQQ